MTTPDDLLALEDRLLIDRIERLAPPDPAPDASSRAIARARALLDSAIQDERIDPTPIGSARSGRGRPRAIALAAAAAAALGLVVVPALVDRDAAPALASAEPLTFPLTPTAVPAGLGRPVFEADGELRSARYGRVLDGLTVIANISDPDYWTVPADATPVDVDGRPGLAWRRAVRDGGATTAPALTVRWQLSDEDWASVTGSGEHADLAEVEEFAESLREEPQQVRLSLDLAPRGWAVSSYREDRILTLAERGGDAGQEITVSLLEAMPTDLEEYGIARADAVRVHDRAALAGQVDAGGWVLVARAADGTAFSLQAPASLTRAQVVAMGRAVEHR